MNSSTTNLRSIGFITLHQGKVVTIEGAQDDPQYAYAEIYPSERDAHLGEEWHKDHPNHGRKYRVIPVYADCLPIEASEDDAEPEAKPVTAGTIAPVIEPVELSSPSRALFGISTDLEDILTMFRGFVETLNTNEAVEMIEEHRKYPALAMTDTGLLSFIRERHPENVPAELAAKRAGGERNFPDALHAQMVSFEARIRLLMAQVDFVANEWERHEPAAA